MVKHAALDETAGEVGHSLRPFQRRGVGVGKAVHQTHDARNQGALNLERDQDEMLDACRRQARFGGSKHTLRPVMPRQAGTEFRRDHRASVAVGPPTLNG